MEGVNRVRTAESGPQTPNIHELWNSGWRSVRAMAFAIAAGYYSTSLAKNNGENPNARRRRSTQREIDVLTESVFSVLSHYLQGKRIRREHVHLIQVRTNVGGIRNRTVIQTIAIFSQEATQEIMNSFFLTINNGGVQRMAFMPAVTGDDIGVMQSAATDALSKLQVVL